MRTQKFVLLGVVLAGIIAVTNCSKGNADEKVNALSELPSVISKSGGAVIDSVTPMTISQRALIRFYILDKQKFQAKVSSYDPLLDEGIFTLHYSTVDSLLMSFKCKTRDTLYVKQVRSPSGDADAVYVYYRGQVYDARLESFDNVEREIRNITLYIILLRSDIKDFLEKGSLRFVYDCACERATRMISAGFGGTGSASYRRALAAMNSYSSFWGCGNVRIVGVDTSCEPLSSHGLCVTTVEWTGDCPWYAIPFGLA